MNFRRLIERPFRPTVLAYHIAGTGDDALCITAKAGGECPKWVISCRDRSDSWCPLYPRKLPRLSPLGAAAKGHELPRALWAYYPGKRIFVPCITFIIAGSA